MTNNPKSKRSSGLSWMDLLMPANPTVNFTSPLSPTEIVNILEGLGTRDVVTAKVETIEAPTGTFYKFYIHEKQRLPRSSSKYNQKSPIGAPFDQNGEV